MANEGLGKSKGDGVGKQRPLLCNGPSRAMVTSSEV